MPNITNIEIRNFKFFTNQAAISVNAKHLLIYGENGSGKSSLYWALYTLLESANKPATEVKKYFVRDDRNEDLLNIYAQPNADGSYDSFVKVTLEDNTIYEISGSNTTSINTNDAQKSRSASDFLSYRLLFKTHIVKHRDTIDFFEVFEDEIMPYIEFTNPIHYTDFSNFTTGQPLPTPSNSKSVSEIWTHLQRKIPVAVAATPELLNQIGEQIIRNSSADTYNHFKTQLAALLSEIQQQANDILQNKFGYPIQINITPTFGNYRRTVTQFIKPSIKIPLVISQYNNTTANIINRPQSFLNEAKLSAISLAIRLAFLPKRLDTAPLKLLVLDDLMISLDMNNRDKVLNLILDQYVNRYQVFILTHDRQFYHYIKQHLQNRGIKRQWQLLEMYIGQNPDNNQEYPAIYALDNVESLKKAKYHLLKHDYPACGMYLRKQCEAILDELLPDTQKYYLSTADDTGIYETEAINLHKKLTIFRDFCTKESINYLDYQDLITYKNVLLNTLAHNDISSPLYKEELVKTMAVLEKLQEIKRNTVVMHSNKKLHLRLEKGDGTFYAVEVKLQDNLKLLEVPNQPKRLSKFYKVRLHEINNNGALYHPNMLHESLQDVLDSACSQYGIAPPPVLDVFKDTEGLSLNDKITALN